MTAELIVDGGRRGRQHGYRPDPDGWARPSGQPWSVRLAGVSQGSPALELYERDSLVDVVTATRLAPRLLRGARLTADGSGRPRVIAWGRLPSSGDLAVSFSRGRLRRRARAAPVIAITGWCWLATADGPYRRVQVSAGGRREQRRLRRGRGWR